MRARTGNVFWSKASAPKLYARIRLEGRRPCVHLAFLDGVADRTTAEERGSERARVIQEMVTALERSGHASHADLIINDAAKMADVEPVKALVARIVGGAMVLASQEVSKASTFGEVANMWTSGEIAKRWPDHVSPKKSAKHDEQQLAIHVLPLLKNVPIQRFTRDHAQQVMVMLDPSLSKRTRQVVAGLMRRVLNLAVEPMGLIKATPLPRGWVPKVKRSDQKPQAMPYPDEVDRGVSTANAAPLAVRLFVGFMAREGLRHDEGERLDWADIDLDRGTVRLEENKTNRPRRWTMNRGSWRALTHWYELMGKPKRTRPVFVDDKGNRLHVSCDELRALYSAALIDRHELHHGSKTTQPTGFHGLRSMFVTENLANNKTEKWCNLRTGHTTSSMLRHYDSDAAMFREAGIPPSGPLDVLLGFAAAAPTDDGSTGKAGAGAGSEPSEEGSAAAEDDEETPAGASSRSSDVAFESPNRGSNPRAGTSGSRSPGPRSDPNPDPTASDEVTRPRLVAAMVAAELRGDGRAASLYAQEIERLDRAGAGNVVDISSAAKRGRP